MLGERYVARKGRLYIRCRKEYSASLRPNGAKIATPGPWTANSPPLRTRRKELDY
jgi:hypothetical protein